MIPSIIRDACLISNIDIVNELFRGLVAGNLLGLGHVGSVTFPYPTWNGD